jgi:hypothetical protein
LLGDYTEGEREDQLVKVKGMNPSFVADAGSIALREGQLSLGEMVGECVE